MDIFRRRTFVEGKRPWGQSQAPNSQPSEKDRWLSHVAAFSQLGVLIVTVVTLSYTVIPVYQKAVLEEAVAQKQVELREVQTAVDKLYGDVRSLAVGYFAFDASLKCSQLYEVVPTNGQRPTIFGPAQVPIHPAECLKRKLSELTIIEHLNPHDFIKLSAEVERAGEEIESRLTAIGRQRDDLQKRQGDFLADLAMDRPRTEYKEFAKNRIQILNSISWDEP